MLVNLKEILEPAREQHYAVGHFNTLNVEMARAVIRAAEEAGAPVILGIEERQLDICPIDEFAAFSVASQWQKKPWWMWLFILTAEEHLKNALKP